MVNKTEDINRDGKHEEKPRLRGFLINSILLTVIWPLIIYSADWLAEASNWRRS